MHRSVIAAAVVLLAAGCSSSASKPVSSPAAVPDSTTSQASAPAVVTSAAAQLNKLGSAVTVKTSTGTLEVTALKVVDPAKPAQSNLTLTSGRWVAVQFRFTNKGPGAASGPLYGMRGLDAQSQPIEVQADAEIAAGPSIDVMAGLNLAPGDSLLGYITFRVPTGVKMVRVQYAPPGGSMAQWSLG